MNQKKAIVGQIGQSVICSLDKTDRLILIWQEYTIVASGAVMCRHWLPKIFELRQPAAVLGFFRTNKEHRRRGLYKYMLHETARVLRNEGVAEILVEVAPDNDTSRRVIDSARYARMADIDLVVFGGGLIFHGKKWKWIR
ncbi:MAG: GNAT family N-acetyltransferase [Desulfuromonadaceae bacterium]|nr:GNAT family N-acetyltransferase [Desulfuromonadaceae bacterium]